MKFTDTKVGVARRNEYKHLSPRILNDGLVPITRETQEYHIPLASNSSKKHGAVCRITQFPLRLSWASTAHKLQGCTLRDTDLVSNGDKFMETLPSAHGVAYVMLSRCSKIENMYLSDDFSLDMIKCSPASLIETLNLDDRCIIEKEKGLRFNIFYINSQNLNNHYLDIQTDRLANQSDIVCLSETWLNPNQSLDWPEKEAIYASYGNGKGVCLYYTPNKHFYEVGIRVEEKYQLISFVLKDKNIQLFLMYLSKGCPLNEIAEDIKSLIKPKFKLCIFGDFNFDKSEANILIQFLESCKLDQIINDPTQMAGRTLDHVYIDKNMKNNVEILSTFRHFSDHVSFSINFK